MYVITMVGTSLLTNYMSCKTLMNTHDISNAHNSIKKAKEFAKDFDDFDPYVYKIMGDEDSTSGIKPFFKGVQLINGYWEVYGESLNVDASAEIKSTIKYWETTGKKDLTIQLLAIDTWLSVLSALLIKSWFEAAKQYGAYHNINVLFDKDVDYVRGLTTELPDGADADEYFRNGFLALIEKVKKYFEQQMDAAVNITGGYKGFIPIITILSQIEGFNLFYLYEESEQLIHFGSFKLSRQPKA